MKDKIIIKYQIYSPEGDPVLEPYHNKIAADYMVATYFKNHTVIEIEILMDIYGCNYGY